jgi:uncharacterized protein YdiU (UPF0061 family)
LENTFQTMTAHKIDFTLFFSTLRRLEKDHYHDKFIDFFEDRKSARTWLELWLKTRDESGITPSESQTLMNAANPIYIPRNHQVEVAIQAGQAGDYAPMHSLCAVLKNPFKGQAGAEKYEAAPSESEQVRQTFCGT